MSQVSERAERYESAIEELKARIKNVSTSSSFSLFLFIILSYLWKYLFTKLIADSNNIILLMSVFVVVVQFLQHVFELILM